MDPLFTEEQLNRMSRENIISLMKSMQAHYQKQETKIQILEEKTKELEFLNAMLSDRLALAQRKQFGSSSEKYADGYTQLNLFNEAEQEQDTALLEEEQEETKTVTFTVKKGRSTDKDRYAGLPVEKKYLDVPEEERFCPDCKSPLLEIGETFVRRELKFKPASFKVVEYYSKNYKYPKCSPNLKTPVIVQ